MPITITIKGEEINPLSMNDDREPSSRSKGLCLCNVKRITSSSQSDIGCTAYPLTMADTMKVGKYLYTECEKIKHGKVKERHINPRFSFGKKVILSVGLILLSGIGRWSGFLRCRNSEDDSIYGFINENNPDQIGVKILPSNQNSANDSVEHIVKNSSMHIVKRHVAPTEKSGKGSIVDEDVKIINLTDCREQRANLAFPDILRVISKTIRYPIASLIEEGRIVVDYSIYGKGCTENNKFNKLSSKIESAVNSLFSLVPPYNRARLITQIAATVLDMIADSIEHKELSISYIEDIEGNIINLTKDMISSLSTLQVNGMITSDGDTAIKSMMNAVKYKNNQLVIRTSNPLRDVAVKHHYGHFIDEKKKRYVFYNKNKKWVINNNLHFNNEVKKIELLIDNVWKDNGDILFLMNSSPTFYGDAILIRHSDELHVAMNDILYPAKEFQISERVFRYLALENIVYSPLAQRAGKWIFEPKTTPSAGKELINLLKNNDSIKSRLVRKAIMHSDVGPITSARSFQFDKDHHRFLKINNGYYRVKKDKFGAMYIDGDCDFLPLKMVGHQLDISSHVSHGQFSYHKRALQRPAWLSHRNIYYLDDSVLQVLSQSDLFANARQFFDKRLSAEGQISAYSKIDGAFLFKGNSYFLYQNRLLVVKALGGDYYSLVNGNNPGDNILLYKNARGNTYYLFKNHERSTKIKYNLRRFDCRAKRQAPSGCMNVYYETPEFSSLLKRNIHNGLHIPNAKETLELYSGIDGFYKNKKDRGSLYYLSKENVFFHVDEVSSVEDRITPVYFKIYGKKMNDEINPDLLISEVCILKDFYDKRTIVSTPVEAQELALDLDKAYSQKLLRWQQRSTGGTVVDSKSKIIDALSQKLSDNFNLNEVKDLFELVSKKSITSINNAEQYINSAKKEIISDSDSFDYKTLASIEREGSNVVLKAIFSEAYNNVIDMVGKSNYFVTHDRFLVDEYMSERLKISNAKAVDLFIDSFAKVSGRIQQLFDMHNKENIILMIRKLEDSTGTIKNKININNRNVLGFSFVNDPLDRVFLNADIIPDDLTVNDGGYEGFSQQEYYVNLMSETLCHEAIHALGNPDDYFYHSADQEGKLQQVEDAIEHIEYYILTGLAFNERFNYLCKLYFMSNPVYNGINIDSLMNPLVFHQLFLKDNFLRSMMFINNPDTLSLLIRDFSRDHVLLL